MANYKMNARKFKKKEMRTLLVIGILIFSIIFTSLALAHGNFNETKELIDSRISCSNLNEGQLEEIGDYYMEQMHPGEAHEMMHQMMGGEDSETTKLMHINMAKSIYCGEQNGEMMGMMNMMMGGGGMMGGNMMGGYNYGYGNYTWNIYNILFLILVLGLIIIVILVIIKLLKDLTRKNKR